MSKLKSISTCLTIDVFIFPAGHTFSPWPCWNVAYGEGIASYINDSGVDLAPNKNLQGQTVPLLGWLVYCDHYWHDRWSSSIGYSETW